MKKTGYVFAGIAISLSLALFFLLLRQNKNITASNQDYSSNQQSDAGLKYNNTDLENINDVPVDDYNVPILMYHYIRDYKNLSDPIGINLSVSPQKFKEQLDWLKNNNYQTRRRFVYQI